MSKTRSTIALLILASGVLASCGDSTSPAADTAAAKSAATSTTSAGESTESGSSTTAAASVADCGGAEAATVKAHLTSTAITKVTVDGGCHEINIATSLGKDVAAGLAICDSAAEVAYTGKILSLRVESATNVELAIGAKGSQCIGEP